MEQINNGHHHSLRIRLSTIIIHQKSSHHLLLPEVRDTEKALVIEVNLGPTARGSIGQPQGVLEVRVR